MYTLSCECGNRISVRLAQAGMTVDCSSCNTGVSVPTVSQLKQLAGDSNPYLDAVKRIEMAVGNMSPPFDGECQKCQDSPATVGRWVVFDFLDEREVSDYEGVQGRQLVVGASQEHWLTVRFPLLMCSDCHLSFKRSWRRSALLRFAKGSTTLIFLIPVYLVLMVLTLFLPFISIPVVILITVMAFQHHTRKMVDPYVLSTLNELPFVRESIEQADEYHITVGRPHTLHSDQRCEHD